MKVDDYINALIAREGGYVFHPADRGGQTIWGITERVARAFGYAGHMEDMPQDVARRIYIERYWEQPHLDDVCEYSAPAAEKLLDIGVNMGVGMAGAFLQRALNTLNLEAKIYPDIVIDGAIGRMTLAALRAYLDYRGADGHVVLVRILDCIQGARRLDIAEANPSQEAFVYGWFLNRVGQ